MFQNNKESFHINKFSVQGFITRRGQYAKN